MDAKDKDKGANSRLQFYLSGDTSSHFSLDSSTGRLIARKDVQKDSRHSLEIQVFDSGKPALSSSKQLTISVVDARLFPTFTSSVSQVLIKEAERTAGKYSFHHPCHVSHSPPLRPTHAGSQLNQWA